MDKHLLDNYILCLTEAQLETNDDILPIESALQRQYRVLFNAVVNKIKSIAYGYSNQITIFLNENFDAIFSNTPILIALIYRLPNSPLSVFIDCLRYLVGRNIDVFLGGF